MLKMKDKYLPGILVVEGKDDQAMISSFLKSEILVTNGYELDKCNLQYLKQRSINNPVFILTDSDSAGEKIRNLIHKNISNYVDIFVDVDKCNKNGKHGVAECKIDEIMLKLQPYLSESQDFLSVLSIEDLYQLCLIGNNSLPIRKYVCEKYNLGICNGKKLLSRLNYLSISFEDLSKTVEEYLNGNK